MNNDDQFRQYLENRTGAKVPAQNACDAFQNLTDFLDVLLEIYEESKDQPHENQ